MIRKIVLLLLLTIVAGALVFGLLYSSRQSRLHIVLSEGLPATLTLTSENGEVIEKLIDSSDTTLLLPSGRYMTVVSSQEGTFFSVINTLNFFRTTDITPTLSPQQQIEFIGTNPGTCLVYDSSLLSFNCEGDANNLVQHMSATNDSPSYPLRINRTAGVVGDIIDYVTFEEKNFILTRDLGRFGQSLYKVIQLSSTGRPGNYIVRQAELNTNNPLNSHGLVHYGENLLFYDKQSLETMTVLNPNNFQVVTGLENIAPQKPEGLHDIEVFASSKQLGIAFSNGSLPEVKQKKTVLYVFTDAQEPLRLEFPSLINSPSFCGMDRVCGYSNNRLVLVDTKTAKTVAEISQVKSHAFNEDTGSLLLVFPEYVISYGVAENIGFVAADLAGYEVERINKNGTIVTVSGFGSVNALLLKKELGSNPILSYLLELDGLPYVQALSVYRQKVFISPAVGEPEFIEEEGVFDFNPVLKNQVNSALEAFLLSSSPPAGYSFTNILN